MFVVLQLSLVHGIWVLNMDLLVLQDGSAPLHLPLLAKQLHYSLAYELIESDENYYL